MTITTERLRLRHGTTRLELRRFLPTFILAGYGIFIISLFVRHVMTWYINPGYVGPTTFAGAVLLGIAIVRLRRASAPSCGDAACKCDDASPRLGAYGLLLIPLVLAVLFPPRGLAAFSALQRGTQIAGLTTFHGAAPVKRINLTVDTSSFSMQDWVGALSADPNPKDYLGKPVNVSGIVIHSPASVPPGFIMVIRYFVTCCIADARPVGVIVRDTSHGSLQDNQWVTVKGVMAGTSYQGQQVAIVNPKVLQVTKSQDPYIY